MSRIALLSAVLQLALAGNAALAADAADVCLDPSGDRIAFTGTIFNDLASAPFTRLCIIDIDSGNLRQLPCPANNDRLPRWSPNGRHLAFLSDRVEAGNAQLYIASTMNLNDAKATPAIDGFVEYFHWSPDGRKILLGVAGFGADLAGCQGGGTIEGKRDELPDWIPEIDTGDAANLWRSIYVHDLADGSTTKVSPAGLNFWEANWLGDEAYLCVVSDSHSEGSWYSSELRQFSLDDAICHTLYDPGDQVGLPCASPSGAYACITEAVCSDRWIVCGTLKLVDTATGEIAVVDTDKVEVTHAVWRDDDHLLYTGHRGFDTVVAEYSVSNQSTVTHWAGTQRTFGAWYPSVWPSSKGAIAIAEAYDVAPELVELADGEASVIASFASERSSDPAFHGACAQPFSWEARDGLEIQGWLIKPQGDGPFPLVVDIHGGPVWQCRNRWSGRLRGAKVLADHGIASLYPNPRGSSGRGQDFARLVKGDMGGEDTYDYLTACDALVKQGIADSARLGVTGISYGGFMSAWLITQDDRFAASVPISCVADWYSQHREKIGLIWFVAVFFLMVCGELCMAPIAMNMITRLCPKRVVGMMMGSYLLSLSIGSFVAGRLARLTSLEAGAEIADIDSALVTYTDSFTLFGYIAVGTGVFLYLISPLLYRSMHEHSEQHGTSYITRIYRAVFS